MTEEQISLLLEAVSENSSLIAENNSLITENTSLISSLVENSSVLSSIESLLIENNSILSSLDTTGSTIEATDAVTSLLTGISANIEGITSIATYIFGFAVFGVVILLCRYVYKFFNMFF